MFQVIKQTWLDIPYQYPRHQINKTDVAVKTRGHLAASASSIPSSRTHRQPLAVEPLLCYLYSPGQPQPPNPSLLAFLSHFGLLANILRILGQVHGVNREACYLRLCSGTGVYCWAGLGLARQGKAGGAPCAVCSPEAWPEARLGLLTGGKWVMHLRPQVASNFLVARVVQ